jgi:hypothetical protein
LIDKGKEIERTFTAAAVEFIDPNRLHAGKVAVGDARGRAVGKVADAAGAALRIM